MLKNKKILIPVIIALVIILIAYSAFMIYPNCKDVPVEACVTCGTINMFSSVGYMISPSRTNSLYLTQKTLKFHITPLTADEHDLFFKDTPFNLSVELLSEVTSEPETMESVLKIRKNRFYNERNSEVEEEYNNIPSDESIQVWIGFEKPKAFSEYEKYVYYTSYNTVRPCSTAFRSSDNPDDTAMHLRSNSGFDFQGQFYDNISKKYYWCDYYNKDLPPKEDLSFFIKACNTDKKYFEKLLDTDFFKDVNKDIDLEKAFQYIKDNNYDVAGYSVMGSKKCIDEKLKAIPDSFVVDFVRPGQKTEKIAD